MKTYRIRVEKTQVGYYSVECKSLEEAKAQGEYQMFMNPHETMQFNKCEEVRLPKETMIIDQDYLEFTNKGEKNG
jgi:hypothetical protein|tara:strand:- start:1443 stop:1667 length:225 start_codon:yes stop_codon:yes gene_type:complete